jgi:uncharacterized membrane protein
MVEGGLERTTARGSVGPAVLRKLGWSVMSLLVLAFVVRHAPYFTLDPDVYFRPQRAVYIAHTAAIITHIGASMVALVVGPLQLLPQLRKKRRLAAHRWLGRAYMLGILLGSTTGFYMAWLSYGGLAAHLSFASLAVWWLATGLMAYRQILAGQIEAHRRWMIRNYAMTFAAVTLRLWLVLLIFPLGVPYEEAFVAVAWICWVWNIPVAEWLIRGQSAAQRRVERMATATPGLARR